MAKAAGAARPPAAAPRATRRAARCVPGSRAARCRCSGGFPKLKGFKNRNKEYFALVNVEQSRPTFDAGCRPSLRTSLRDAGLVKKRGRVKVLGEGELEQALTVHAHAFSLGAVEKIKAAGGSVEVVE